MALTASRRSSTPFFRFSVSSAMLFAPVLEPDHALADQHRDRPVGAERHRTRREYDFADLLRHIDPLDDAAGVLEDFLRAAPHRELPRVEFAPLATHRDEHEQRKAAFLG